MILLIEFEGPIAYVNDAYYGAYVEAATQIGWSKLDQSTFWRLTRTKGAEADVLPRAPDPKVKDYRQRFGLLLEQPAILQRFLPVGEVVATLSKLGRHGPLNVITLGGNAIERMSLLRSWTLSSLLPDVHPLSPDPRQRPGELKALAKGDRRAIVAACSDALIRSADDAELFTVGLTCGACGAERLHRAGPRIVFKDLSELAASLTTGGADLIRAGLLPPPSGLD